MTMHNYSQMKQYFLLKVVAFSVIQYVSTGQVCFFFISSEIMPSPPIKDHMKKVSLVMKRLWIDLKFYKILKTFWIFET